MMFFKKRKNRTGIKIIITNHVGHTEVMHVHDIGNGPFIYSWSGSTPKYMTESGSFEGIDNDLFGGCEKSWRIHEGSVNNLEFKT